MPLMVRPLQEADSTIKQALCVQYAAFRRRGQIGVLLSPAPELSAEFLASSIPRRREAMCSSKTARYMTVVDSDTDEIVACGHWDMFPEERTAEEVEKLCYVPPCPPASNLEAWNDFFGHFSEQRRKLGTRPIVILHTLVTHPDHQRRGAGKMLLQEMVKDIDAHGLEAYLEGSEMGRSLYARFGFVPIEERVFDLSKYGLQGKEVNTIMLRPPTTSA